MVKVYFGFHCLHCSLEPSAAAHFSPSLFQVLLWPSWGRLLLLGIAITHCTHTYFQLETFFLSSPPPNNNNNNREKAMTIKHPTLSSHQSSGDPLP